MNSNFDMIRRFGLEEKMKLGAIALHFIFSYFFLFLFKFGYFTKRRLGNPS